MIPNAFKEQCFKFLGSCFGPYVQASLRSLYSRITGGTPNKSEMYIMQKGRLSGGKYYVLRYETNVMGLAAVMRDILYIDSICSRTGFKALVEFDSDGCTLDDGVPVNLWEAFFSQAPTVGTVLSDEKSTVVVSPINARGLYEVELMKRLHHNCSDYLFYGSGERGREYRETMRKIFAKYCVIRQDILVGYNQEYETLKTFSSGKKILGVLMREEFSEEVLGQIDDEFHQNILSYHPRVPNVKNFIESTGRMAVENGITKIFVSSLYEKTLDAFREQFGAENVYYIKRKRLTSYKDHCNTDLYKDNVEYEDMFNGRVKLNEDILYERTYSYLMDLYLLSRCDSFLSPICGGGFIAPLLRETEYDCIKYMDQYNENCAFKRGD